MSIADAVIFSPDTLLFQPPAIRTFRPTPTEQKRIERQLRIVEIHRLKLDNGFLETHQDYLLHIVLELQAICDEIKILLLQQLNPELTGSFNTLSKTINEAIILHRTAHYSQDRLRILLRQDTDYLLYSCGIDIRLNDTEFASELDLALYAKAITNLRTSVYKALQHLDNNFRDIPLGTNRQPVNLDATISYVDALRHRWTVLDSYTGPPPLETATETIFELGPTDLITLD
jgi:hypothetical protein